MKQRMDFEERFWKKVDRGDPNECWEWQAATDTNGYGLFYADGQQRGAHRVSYWLEHGEKAGEGWVLHHCDNKPCVNPDHLYLGDASDNAQDRFERGLVSHEGENHPASQLTQEDVDEIRERVENGESQYEIADEFGISQPTVSQLVIGLIWGHTLPDEWEWESKPKDGENNPNAKLTEDDVREIRERVSDGETQGDVAEDYPVSPTAVSKIVRREMWADVE